MKYFYFSVFLTLSLLFTSCSPQKRLQRLIKHHPELSVQDTIIFRDTFYIAPKLLSKGIAIKDLSATPIRFTQNGIDAELSVLNDTVYINVKVPADTIYIDKKIIVEKIKYIKPGLFDKYLKIFPYLIIAFSLVIAIIIIGILKGK